MGITVQHSLLKFFESDAVILGEVITSLSMAVTGVLLVTFWFLPNYLVTFIVSMALISIDVNVLGYMFYWGGSVSTVSMISLVMSVGFSVDFIAHVALALVEVYQGY